MRRVDSLELSFTREAKALHARIAPALTDLDKLRTYVDDPIRFSTEVLGILPWSKQRQVMRSVVTNYRVAVRSGHKCGKSMTFAILALWFYCTRPGARVIIMATTDRQVNGIIWREIKMLARRAKIKIPGVDNIGKKAITGLVNDDDFAEIKGYTAREAEAVAGTSGGAIMYLLDEASGIEENIFQAIQGNLAGGNAWQLMISNPTRADGTFYDAFHSKSLESMGRRGWVGFHIASTESPNITGEWHDHGAKIPGLADDDWVEMMADEWGEDSPVYGVRVRGDFAAAEDGKIFPLAMLQDSEERWKEKPDTPSYVEASGRLWIGVDPAGAGAQGDESVFCARRGKRVLGFVNRRGIQAEMHLAIILEMISTYNVRGPHLPVVVLDAAGDVGDKVLKVLRQHSEQESPAFELSVLRVSDAPHRQPLVYYSLRDEIVANARQWMRDGGAIPLVIKLEQDLHSLEYSSDVKDRLKVSHKDELRKLLGRSPDHGDAFTYSCWEARRFRVDEIDIMTKPPTVESPYAVSTNPYEAMKVWQGGAGGDDD